MATSVIAAVPNRKDVDVRITKLAERIDECRAQIREVESALRIIEYTQEEEVLEKNIAKLKGEGALWRDMTKEEREAQKGEQLHLRIRLKKLNGELEQMIAEKWKDEEPVMRQAESIVKLLLTELDDLQRRAEENAGNGDAVATVAKQLEHRRRLLDIAAAAVEAGLSGKLPLRPTEYRSHDMYFLLPDAPGTAVMLRRAAVGENTRRYRALPVMFVIVGPISFDEETGALVCTNGVVVTQPAVTVEGYPVGGVVYEGPVNEHGEPECPQSEDPEASENYGSATYPDGSTYTGPLSNGHRECTTVATATFINGNVYRGTFSGDAVTGEGTIEYPNGDRYVGQVCNALRHGQGMHTNAVPGDDGARYMGDWVQDIREGHGICEYPDKGLQYEGEWKNGARCGQGTLSAIDGRGSYEGPWASDRKHGEGAVHFAVSGVRFDGKWKKGERRGVIAAFSVENAAAAAAYEQMQHDEEEQEC